MANLILLADSYKTSHWLQYPPNTKKVYSYFEPRIGAKYPKTMFFGLQYILKKYLSTPITLDNINEADDVLGAHMGPGIFNREGWTRILEKHGGFLPIEIKAVPEGRMIPTSNVLMTVEGTDEDTFWVTNYYETLFSLVWYSSTVATISKYIKSVIKDALVLTGNPDLLPYKLHDFGFRGSSSVESAGIGGLSHLVNFLGTDTLVALLYGRDYYSCKMAGYSIPASEHSTITSWLKPNEVHAFKNMLEKFPGMVACVSDSYDIFNACSELWGNQLKNDVLNHKGTLVVRPDSGPIVETVLKVLNILGNKFGTYKNDKGYRILNDKVRVIQGDGCNPSTIREVIEAMIANKWSIDNIAFGMDGGLLQKLDRDTQKFKYSCSSVTVGEEERPVYKEPITDPGKKSKRGRLKLSNDNEVWRTYSNQGIGYEEVQDKLQTVYKDGKLLVDFTLDEVRANSNLD